jgi:hypothetical protein
VPADLLRAVNHAHVILGWQENLTNEEIPPEWMWSLDDELEEWFDEVGAARRERLGQPAPSRRDEEVPMMSNDLAAAKRAKARRSG